MEDIQDISCGKTCRGHSVRTKVKTSDACCQQSVRSKMTSCQFLDLRSGSHQASSWVMISQLPGESSMLSIGECPNVARESSLSQILQTGGGAAEILFKPESVSGDTSQSGVKRKENSGCLGESSETAVRGMLFENHSQDDRYRELKDCAMSVTANYGTGGNNQPFVVQPSAYRLCAQNSNSMMSDNPNSGIYATNVSSTLDTSNQSPCRNQGGIVVIENSENTSAYGLDRASFNQGRNAKFDFTILKDIEPTMTARGPNAVAFCKVHRTLCSADGPKGVSGQMMNNPEENFVADIYTSSKDSHFTSAMKNCAYCLYASDWKEPQLVGYRYTVRRLTPTECARLQGFPDWWCDGLGTEQPTEDEMAFWTQVFRTHSEIMGTAMKSRKQIEKWLREPHTDSAEYKMWGNGVALPCVRYIMHNIAEQRDIWDKENVWKKKTLKQ